MNNNRRARLSSSLSELSNLHYSVERVKDAIEILGKLKENLDWWSNRVNSIETSIGDIESEEQYALESIPDNFQFGNIASSIDDSLFQIGIAKSCVTSLKDNIDSIENSYISSFLPSFNPSELLDELDDFIEKIEEAKNEVVEAKK